MAVEAQSGLDWMAATVEPMKSSPGTHVGEVVLAVHHGGSRPTDLARQVAAGRIGGQLRGGDQVVPLRGVETLDEGRTDGPLPALGRIRARRGGGWSPRPSVDLPREAFGGECVEDRGHVGGLGPGVRRPVPVPDFPPNRERTTAPTPWSVPRASPFPSRNPQPDPRANGCGPLVDVYGLLPLNPSWLAVGPDHVTGPGGEVYNSNVRSDTV